MPEKNGNDYAVYLLLETKSNTPNKNSNLTVTQVAAPIVLVMPLTRTSTAADPIHMYPKNVTETPITKDIDKDLDKDGLADNGGKSADFVGLGDAAHYIATVTVPAADNNLGQFVITDTPEVGLNDEDSTVKVYDQTGKVELKNQGKVAAVPATASHGAGFTLTYQFTDLSAYAGQKLIIKYAATLNKDLISGQTVTNSIDDNGTPITSVTPVTTGGAKFQKLASDTNSGLAGAQFLVLDSKGEKYLVETDKGDTNKAAYSFKSLPSDFKLGEPYDSSNLDAGAVILTSGDEGKFEISGLAFDNYNVAEIKAPDGYAVLDKLTNFTVNADSYTKTLNKITDSPKGLLPSTGGMGIYIVIAAGLALIALGFAFLRRGKHHEEV